MAQRRKIGLRRHDQTRALRPRDAGRRAAISVRPPFAHFDEDNRLAIARDDVDLTHARAEVASDDRKPACREKIRCKRLGARAIVDRARICCTPTLAAIAAALPPEGAQFAPWVGPA